MQRNMDLIRKLLLEIENEKSIHHEFNPDGVQELVYWYHVDLLENSNLIRGIRVRWSSDGTHYEPFSYGLVSLTWQGHDFLDAVRSDSVWKKAKERAQSAGLDMQSLTFEVVKSLCVSTVKHIIGI